MLSKHDWQDWTRLLVRPSLINKTVVDRLQGEPTARSLAAQGEADLATGGF
jgi:hypothetical protein